MDEEKFTSSQASDELYLPPIVIQRGVNPREFNRKLDRFTGRRGCSTFLQLPNGKLRRPETSAPTKSPHLDPKQCLVGCLCPSLKTDVLPSQRGKANPMKRGNMGTSFSETLQVDPTPVLHPKPLVMQNPRALPPIENSSEKVQARVVSVAAQKLKNGTPFPPLMVSGVHIRPPVEPRPNKGFTQRRSFALHRAYAPHLEKHLSTNHHDLQAEGSVQDLDQIKESKLEPVLGRSITMVRRASPVHLKFTKKAKTHAALQNQLVKSGTEEREE